MKQPRWMFRRHWGVSHGRDGFALMVRDEWLPALIAEQITHGLLVALGHPCCDRGPIGRRSGDRLALFWYRVLNLPSSLFRFSRHVIDIPLTPEQAFTISPHWRDETWPLINGVDEFGNTWRDGVRVDDA